MKKIFHRFCTTIVLLTTTVLLCLLTSCNWIGTDYIPMIMVEGKLYLDTGTEVSAKRPSNHWPITSSVSQTKKPKKNDQSNFGFVGSEYIVDEDGLIVNLGDKWFRFEQDKKP